MYLRSPEMGWIYCVVWAGIWLHFAVLLCVCLLLCIDFSIRLDSNMTAYWLQQLWTLLLRPTWSNPQLLREEKKKPLDSLWSAPSSHPCIEGNGLVLIFQAYFWVGSTRAASRCWWAGGRMLGRCSWVNFPSLHLEVLLWTSQHGPSFLTIAHR